NVQTSPGRVVVVDDEHGEFIIEWLTTFGCGHVFVSVFEDIQDARQALPQIMPDVVIIDGMKRGEDLGKTLSQSISEQTETNPDIRPYIIRHSSSEIIDPHADAIIQKPDIKQQLPKTVLNALLNRPGRDGL